jgi:hypothetical protein
MANRFDGTAANLSRIPICEGRTHFT